jgi:hypothetical protein
MPYFAIIFFRHFADTPLPLRYAFAFHAIDDARLAASIAISLIIFIFALRYYYAIFLSFAITADFISPLRHVFAISRQRHFDAISPCAAASCHAIAAISDAIDTPCHYCRFAICHYFTLIIASAIISLSIRPFR